MIKRDISLEEHCSFKIGGSAKYYASIKSSEDIIETIGEWRQISSNLAEKERRIFVLGGGTNLLISDNGFPGLVVHISINHIEKENGKIKVGAGVSMSSVVDFYMDNFLSGFEWAGGLPGTVGGAVRGNAGAFGGETKDSVVEVRSLELGTLEDKIRTREECKFFYRDSIFKSGEAKEEIIISAEFEVKEGNGEEIRKQTEEKIQYRKSRHPLHLPNAGSIFKNVPAEDVSKEVLKEFRKHIKDDPFPVLPAAKLIAEAGLMGRKVGGAMVSTDHPNFIVNVSDAKASDVLELIAIEQRVVVEKYGISLEPEITFVE